ncbi:MAG TPA: tetraacyldisaccharide 4'-kinase [Blastocatellia bacterium]|nr:tetraacyldisaccharide 4'-kinase [Blastocatellia bacterium]
MIAKDKRLKRAMVWLPAKLYELAVRLRVAAYETGYLKPRRLEATVIAVGNITLGGTGKTPMVEYIAGYLRGEAHRVAILTRGYGRESAAMQMLNAPGPSSGGADVESVNSRSYREVGDEPLMLARRLPDVPIVIHKDRFEAGLRATRGLGANVLVLDDAYQHLQLARDLNLLLIDASDPFGDFEMVPLGRLREPLYGIKRADAIIVTRADRPFDQARAQAIIRHFCGDQIPVMYVASCINGLRHLETGTVYEAREFAGWKAALLCGIGNPHAFADDILQAGIDIVSENFFRDHHPFTQADLDRASAAAQQAAADFVIATEKDAVRLEGLRQGAVPLYVAQMGIQSDDEIRLKSLLLRTVIAKKKSGVRSQESE